MSAPTEYETMMVKKYLEERIIAQAQAIWSKEHPLDQHWSTVFEKAGEEYRAHVIVYKGNAGNSGHDELESSEYLHLDPKAALEDLLERPREQLVEKKYQDNMAWLCAYGRGWGWAK